MPAYLLLLAALLIRPGILPHSGWIGFSAVGGSLLYFGATRAKQLWWQMLIPITLLAGSDYYLTTRVYAYDFHWQEYLVTWGWYAAAILLGRILLASKVSVLRVASAALLGPTSFFLVSNYSAWVEHSYPGGTYAPTFSGLLTCYAAGLPFYGRDVISAGLVLTVAFGVPIAIRRYLDSREAAGQHTL